MITWRGVGKHSWLLVNDCPDDGTSAYSKREGWRRYIRKHDETWIVLAVVERVNGLWYGATFPNNQSHLGSCKSSGEMMKKAEVHLKDRKIYFHARGGDKGETPCRDENTVNDSLRVYSARNLEKQNTH